ncbi:MAG: hypothetical protein AB1797_03860 [bacterium]
MKIYQSWVEATSEAGTGSEAVKLTGMGEDEAWAGLEASEEGAVTS